MSESSKQQIHSLRRFADKTFLCRRITTDVNKVQTYSLTANDDEISALSSTTDVNEESATSSLTTVSVSEASWTPVSVPRSRIPTPSDSSRRHTCSSRGNAVFSPSGSLQTKSQIPRSATMRPSDGVLNVVGRSPTPNQDGRYPLFAAENQRRPENQGRSDVGASQCQLWGTHDEEAINRNGTADTMMPPRFKSATFGSGAEIAGYENLKPDFSWPVLPRTQPDCDGDDETPTMMQFTNLEEPSSIVDSYTSAIHPFENVPTSHSPPASRYRVDPNMRKESSAQITGLASSVFAMPNYGDYSFDASHETIGLALTTPIPISSEGDRVYETATKATEPLEFVLPERFDRFSGTQDYRHFKSSSEITEGSRMGVRISPQMDQEHLCALKVSSQPPPSSPSQSTSKGKLTSSSLSPFLVDYFRPINRILVRPCDCALGPIPHPGHGASLNHCFLHAERKQIRQHA